MLQTLFRRRQALERLRLGIRILGSRFDRDTQRLREISVRNRLLYDWVDADDRRAQAWLAELGIDDTGAPVVLLDGGRFLTLDPGRRRWSPPRPATAEWLPGSQANISPAP